MTWQLAAKRIATAKGFTSLEEILEHSEKLETQTEQQERKPLENSFLDPKSAPYGLLDPTPAPCGPGSLGSLHLTDRNTTVSTVMLRVPAQQPETVIVVAATTVTEAIWQQAVQILEEHRAELGTFYRLMLTLTAASIVVRGDRPKHAIIPMMIPATAIAEAAGFSES